ncbi:hypothetical protein JOB18_044953 [Solea senegalensis]|uniref:Uncharacterized protein n=1 Tax=Solea senegalensis TaxID=28829 RepID=A0AAV6TB99_SOLSE|nr:hypothetical protein JOB18_044953 [Solea senegalensis]
MSNEFDEKQGEQERIHVRLAYIKRHETAQDKRRPIVITILPGTRHRSITAIQLGFREQLFWRLHSSRQTLLASRSNVPRPTLLRPVLLLLLFLLLLLLVLPIR